ncbi:MAG TPA: SipW-dependent-type signal peptide-containing protein [Candidatus Thermoplasmatota archaeon]|nr:SipW-dependent-type signal peptide-containing protein [Candidatus Thermoplasmatota archaeon]
MNYKILASLLLIGVASASVGYGTYAVFTAEESSPDNLFSTGTLTLSTTSGTGNVDAFIGGGNFAPGDTASGTLKFVNTGSIKTGDAEGHEVALKITFSNTYQALAEKIQITSMSYGGTPITGYANLWALNGQTLTLADPGAGDGKTLAIAVKFDSTAGNDLQGKDNKLGLSVVLTQVLPS